MPTVGDRRAASAPTGLIERVAPAARGGEHVVDRLAGPERVTQLGERRDERAEPLAQMVLVRRGDVLPDARRTAGKPRRVHETGSGQLEPGVTPEGADDVHQGTDGQLWEVADRPDQAVVQLGTHDVRDAAEAADGRPRGCGIEPPIRPNRTIETRLKKGSRLPNLASRPARDRYCGRSRAR